MLGRFWNNRVAWYSSITVDKDNDLEGVQKVSLKILLKDKYKDYESAQTQIHMDTLKLRRVKLCLNFAIASKKHEKDCPCFP